MSRHPVGPADADWLLLASDRWRRTQRWSLHRRSPSPRLVEANLAGPALRREAVWSDQQRPIGLFEIVSFREGDGVAELSLLVDGEWVEELSGELKAFLDGAFVDVPGLRKLTVGAFTDELDLSELLAERARPAGRLDEHAVRGESYVDLVLYEVWPQETPCPRG